MKEITIGILFNNEYTDLNNLFKSFYSEGNYIKEFIIISNRANDLRGFDIIIERHSNRFKIRVDYNIINTGASGGRNRLLDLCSTKYMIFCDCDTTVTKGILKILLETIKKYRKIYAIVPKIYFGGTKIISWGDYGRYYASIVNCGVEDNDQINWSLRFGGFVTTCVLININEWKINNIRFDNELFVYMEEPEIMEYLKSSKNSIRCLFQPDAVAYHNIIFLQVTGKYFDRFRIYLNLRNKLIMGIKYISPISLLIAGMDYLKLPEFPCKLKIRAILFGVKLGLFKLFGFYKGKIIDSREYKFVHNLSKSRVILR